MVYPLEFLEEEEEDFELTEEEKQYKADRLLYEQNKEYELRVRGRRVHDI